MNDAHRFLRSRRSVRRFEPQPVPRATLHRILETATYAPSAHHRQHWRFVVLETPEAKTRLADAMGAEFERDLTVDGLNLADMQAQVARSRNRILGAPVAIVLCFDSSVGDDYADADRQRAEWLMGAQSAALAGLQLLQAAHAEGLGGVWTCGPLFAPEAVRRALGIPSRWEPQALMLIGHPAQIPAPRLRKPVEEVTVFL
ncbi:MAG: nitroreductase family protein [Chloroflexi bacterium]|jgi:coenzyme F420-0:L-glutamate ligase / coenzyme F420-1:gamma-L-glutamate ligase|nr:nitroreductase family protein [Chloroflexota bacterium]